MPLDVAPALIEDARRRDADLDRLIAAVWPEAFRIALSILRDPGLAEDVAQDACANIARSLEKLKDTRAFAAWSYRIIVNHATIRARTRLRSAESPRSPAEGSSPTTSFESSSTEALDLHNALSTLSPTQRAAVLLHYYAGLNSAEIAAAIGMSPSTVRFHLMLARKALRKALSPPQTLPRASTEAS